MVPIRQGDGTGLAAKGYSQVRKGDGTVLWNAIPDSEANQKLAHRWPLDDVNGTVEDSVGEANGSNNGVTSVSGEYAGGSAGEGDGVGDHISIDINDIQTWINDTTTDHAVALTVDFSQLPDDRQSFFGVYDRDTSGTSVFELTYHNPGVRYELRDADGDNERIETDDDLPEGEVRIVINAKNNDQADFESWFNQAEVSNSPTGSTGYSNIEFKPDLFLFAANDGGVSDATEAILDDICLFNDSLTQAEIESYDNPWE